MTEKYNEEAIKVKIKLLESRCEMLYAFTENLFDFITARNKNPKVTYAEDKKAALIQQAKHEGFKLIKRKD